MIVRLCESTPKLAIRIVESICGGGQFMDTDVELHVKKRTCRKPDEPGYYLDHCFNKIPKEVVPTPMIKYPAFEVDDDGRVVFYFDNNLWSQPSGRYDAFVIIGGEYTGLKIEIDLCKTSIEIDQVAATSQPPTFKGDALC